METSAGTLPWWRDVLVPTTGEQPPVLGPSVSVQLPAGQVPAGLIAPGNVNM